MPAQLTSAWMAPKRLTAASSAAVTSSGLVTSAGAKRALSPMSAATWAPGGRGGGAGQVQEHDAPAAGEEPLGGGAPEARRAARDDCGGTRDLHARASSTGVIGASHSQIGRASCRE